MPPPSSLRSDDPAASDTACGAAAPYPDPGMDRSRRCAMLQPPVSSSWFEPLAFPSDLDERGHHDFGRCRNVGLQDLVQFAYTARLHCSRLLFRVITRADQWAGFDVTEADLLLT